MNGIHMNGITTKLQYLQNKKIAYVSYCIIISSFIIISIFLSINDCKNWSWHVKCDYFLNIVSKSFCNLLRFMEYYKENYPLS